MKGVVAIAGAGPAGLTTALELLRRSHLKPIVFELDSQVGGISKTINYRGNRMDLGGHRFFSKSDWVMKWWQQMLPVADDAQLNGKPLHLAYQGAARTIQIDSGSNPAVDRTMLVRSRLSRIYYRRKFFDYPLKLNAATLGKLGASYTVAVMASYLKAQAQPRSPETSLEDFLINRFGDKLYRTFFKDYTEKVWGVPCAEISAQWGAQRIKGLSIRSALKHAILKPFKATDTAQKAVETSLIERFLYPKLGPGQMWEETATCVAAEGGEVHLNHRVVGIQRKGKQVVAVDVRDESSGELRSVPCEYFVSTMPVKELAELLKPEDPTVAQIAGALPYRDFMTAGLLLKRMQGASALADNWIYVQEPDVKLGRVQVFNNWSPALVADPSTIWLGLEYFCAEGDELWSMRDAAFLDFSSRELAKIGLADIKDVLDGTVVRVRKAYPAYFGSYSKMSRVREYLDGITNLFPIGRNGMHRYNNQDHSMLAAKAAVDCMVSGSLDKTSVWSVNTEEEYHEESRSSENQSAPQTQSPQNAVR